MAAKRMVAEAARPALDGLRAARRSEHRFPVSPCRSTSRPGTLPTSWDACVQASVARLPTSQSPAGRRRGAGQRPSGRRPATWRALVVVDGTDRTGRAAAASAATGTGFRRHATQAVRTQGHPGWQPSLPAADGAVRQGPAAPRTRTGPLWRCGASGRSRRDHGARPARRSAEIERYVAAFGRARSRRPEGTDLAANPLLLALDVIAGHRPARRRSTDLFDRVIDVLLGDSRGHRPLPGRDRLPGGDLYGPAARRVHPRTSPRQEPRRRSSPRCSRATASAR